MGIGLVVGTRRENGAVDARRGGERMGGPDSFGIDACLGGAHGGKVARVVMCGRGLCCVGLGYLNLSYRVCLPLLRCLFFGNPQHAVQQSEVLRSD